MALSDFTDAADLGVTIAGAPFPHRLYHFVLAYSGWEHAAVVLGGESFNALAENLQNALWALGVPDEHRSDSLSAAYRNLDAEAAKDVTRRYDEFCAHYGMAASRLGEAHENGAVVAQPPPGCAPSTRRCCAARATSPTSPIMTVRRPARRLQELGRRRGCRTRQGAGSAGPARHRLHRDGRPGHQDRRLHGPRIFYSAPSRLIGQRLRVHVYDDRIEAWLGATHVLSHPRLRGRGDGVRLHRVDYRHVIHALRCAAALAGSVYRDGLFPRSEYAAAWAAPPETLPRRCSLPHGPALALAHDEVCKPSWRADRRDSAAGRLPDARDLEDAALNRVDGRCRPTCRWRSPSCQLRRPAGRAHDLLHVHDRADCRCPRAARHADSTASAESACHWSALPSADKEMACCRFLAALAEVEIAERETRRIRRHLIESRLPGGKTLATFDFKVAQCSSRRGAQALRRLGRPAPT